MRILCDSNVLVRAAINPNRLAGELLRQIRASHVLIASLQVLTETLIVLQRPQIRALHGLDDRGIRRFITSLYKAASIVVVPRPIPRVVPNDPKDDAVLLTAIGGKANYLATRDKHLFHPNVVALAAQYGVSIVSDDDLLARLRVAKP